MVVTVIRAKILLYVGYKSLAIFTFDIPASIVVTALPTPFPAANMVVTFISQILIFVKVQIPGRIHV